MPLLYETDSFGAKNITGGGYVMRTYPMAANGRVGISLVLESLNGAAATITLRATTMDASENFYGTVLETVAKPTGDTRLRLELERPIFIPSGFKVRISVASTGSSNTSAGGTYFLFNPNCVILDNADHGGAAATLQLDDMTVSNQFSIHEMLVSDNLSINDFGMATLYVQKSLIDKLSETSISWINDFGMATLYVQNTAHFNGQVTFEESITVNGVISAAFNGNLSGSIGSLATQAKADVKAESESALETYGLDHLIHSAVDTNFATTVHLDSVIGHLVDNGTSASFDRSTDSLEAQRDNIGTSGAGLANVSANVVQFGGSNGHFANGRPEVNMSHIAGSGVNTGQAQLGVNVVNAGGGAISASGGVMAVNATQLAGSAVQQDSGYIKVSQGTSQGQLDLTSGRIGVDWAKVSNQGSTVGLSGTTVKTATDVETDTQDIQAKIGSPAGASVSADIAAIKGETAAILDDTGTTGVVVASGSKTGYSLSSTGMNGVVLPNSIISAASIASNAISDVKIASNAITSAKIANDAITSAKIQDSAITVNKIATGAIDADALAADVVLKIWSGNTIAESYADAGQPATPAELLYMLWSACAQFSVSGDVITCKELNGSSGMTFTLDSATNPTLRTRAT